VSAIEAITGMKDRSRDARGVPRNRRDGVYTSRRISQGLALI